MPKKIVPKYGYMNTGWVKQVELSKETEIKLRAICNDDNFISQLQYAAEDHKTNKDADIERPKPKEVLAALDDVYEKINALLFTFNQLDDETSEQIRLTIEDVTGKYYPSSDLLPSDCKSHLTWLRSITLATSRNIDLNKPRARASRILTLHVAEIFNKFNLNIKEYSEGDFCTCLSILATVSPETAKTWTSNYLKNI
ncbi:MAG: hypothetical protein KZQ94_04615 [Candidatus Thiodiazotropha sp. (ex Troendleina suluensis)]|nr:hypothetical protein [Candidatus Thiodiazotropha sp. (ex Troendleina suluensis)]